MALKVGKASVSERRYMAKFKAMAADYGIAITYEEDLAAVDLGLHITLDTEEGAEVGNTKVWFQLKGISKSKLSSKQFDTNKNVTYSFEVEHLRHWYDSHEVVYIVIYVASKDVFLKSDIRDLVSEGRLNGLPSNQKTYTVHIAKDAEMNEAFWQKLHQHKSMRTDRFSHKGNALVHDRGTDDVLQMPEASLFQRIVDALLAEHRYGVTEKLNADRLFPHTAKGAVSVSVGMLYSRYEWIWRLTAELGVDEDGLREEGSVLRASGKCAVLVHSQVAQCLDVSDLKELRNQLQARGVQQLLVFINHYALGVLGSGSCPCFHVFWEGISEGATVQCFPQHLEDISYKVLTTNNVYEEFRQEMRWMTDRLEEKVRSGEWSIISPDEYFRRIGIVPLDEEIFS